MAMNPGFMTAPGGVMLPPTPVLQQQIQNLQLENQWRLAKLVSNQLSVEEHGQVNPALSQELANMAIASGLAGGKVHYSA